LAGLGANARSWGASAMLAGVVGGPGLRSRERVSVCFDIVARAPVLREWYTEHIMSERVKRILEEVRSLPESEKRLVRDALREDDGDEGEAVSAAWGKELAERIADIDSGRVQLVPIDEVIAAGRARLNRTR
jgi:protein involved in temperature-dependent protein secretion